jgi:DNA (cytosine-5)-methyltransferase 1
VATAFWDKYSQKTYFENFGDLPFGDITSEETKSFIPDGFDILCGGFPCQAFSIAGKRAGFNDTRGTLFHDVAEIIRRKRPRAVFLENVKGLFNHDRGKTLLTILSVLRDDLGYTVPDPQVLNARHFGVPQNRERVFIIGFRDEADAGEFKYPERHEGTSTFEEVKEEAPVSVKYYLSTKYLETLREHRRRHESKGNGFG